MEDEAELIRQQMFETRSSLSDKLENLEEQVAARVKGTTESVVETVDAVKDAVEHTVHTVQDSVHETVESVKETFNVSRHVEEHPWAMLGGAIVAGIVAERLLARALPPAHHVNGRTPEPLWNSVPSRQQPAPEPRSEPAGPNWTSTLLEALQPAMKKLGGLAVGATTAIIGEVIHDHVPDNMRGQMTEILDGVTTALGGTPIHPTRKPNETEAFEESSAYHRAAV